ncbi:hypothetical protein PYCCODRAFT_1481498 [Trametes coccinea BRFM310]|uniref:DUF7918 domain-containing protein n=1 Tax=Trametes coccinea (strain BRFM310) TaxID=1353009 RepID=A0A1Y2I7J4_TRAC3|nr:hypothetical protein PYCCODRAFT_1481498 [Trametes coccinea BRFM310]
MPLSLRGYEAYISCDGQELDTYQANVENDKVVSCYIGTDAGKNFAVHWIDSKPPTHLSVEVRVDGRRIGVVSHTKGPSKLSTAGLRISLGSHDFTQGSHDDALPSAYSEELGVIEVRMRRVREFIAVPSVAKAPVSGKPSHSAPPKGRRTSVGDNLNARQREIQKKTVLRPILIDDKPYVSFKFLYRPKSFLKRNGMIPSASGSTPCTSRSRGKKRKSDMLPPSASVATRSSKRQRAASIPERGAQASENLENHADATAAPSMAVEPMETYYGHELDYVDNAMAPEPLFSTADTTSPRFQHIQDSDEEDSRVVETHLSSVGSRPTLARASHGSAVVTHEQTTSDVKVEMQSETTGLPWTSAFEERDIKPSVGDDVEECVVEVHVNSKNQAAVFGRPPETRLPGVAVKKEEDVDCLLWSNIDSPPANVRTAIVKQEEQMMHIESAVVKQEVEDTVEVHLSSTDIHRAFQNVSTFVASVKQEQ